MDDKYESFYKELQALLISRPVTPKEIADYVQFIATYDMEINAFIAIVNYCVAIKGSSIKSPYILKFAKCFAQDGVLTAEQVEKALKAKSNNENEQKKEASSQEDYLIKLFRKLNPKLKKSVIDIVKGLTTSQDNK